MEKHGETLRGNGELARRRGEQQVVWTWDTVRDRLLDRLHASPQVRALVPGLEDQVREGALPPSLAADQILAAFLDRASTPSSTGATKSGQVIVMDITDLILEDHHRQRQAFARLDGVDPVRHHRSRPASGASSPQFLETHAAAEEAVFYPQLLRRADPDGEQTKDAIGDHNDIRNAVAESARHDVGTPKWWEAVGNARSANTEHMGEEEDEGLADFRKSATLEQRHALGILFEMAKSDPAAPNLDMTDKDPTEYRRRKRLMRHRARADKAAFGLACAVVLFATLAALTSLVLQPFQGADESQHVAYALAVSHGHLPTLTTHFAPRIPFQPPGALYTANHPPLFYLLQAIPLRLGISAGAPLVGFHMARLLNVLIAVAGLYVLAAFLRLLVPQRPAIWIAGTALTACLPITVLISSQLYNDALAVTTSTLTLLAAATLLLRGPSRKRMALLAGAALLATASRATGAEAAFLAVLSAGVAVVLHRPQPDHSVRSRGGLRLAAEAIGACLAVVAAPLLGIGWFYLRNHHLYGDFTGAKLVVRLYPSPKVPVSTSLTSTHFWLGQFKNLFGRPTLLTGYAWQLAVTAGVLVGIAAVAGIARGLFAVATGRLRGPRLAVALLVAVHLLACVALLLEYVSQGGAAFVRYLLPGIPALAILMAYGLADRRLRGWPLAAYAGVTSGVIALTSVIMVARELHSHRPQLGGSGVIGWLAAGLHGTGFGGATAIVWLALAVALAAALSIPFCIARADVAQVGTS